MDPFSPYAGQLDTDQMYFGFRDNGRIENLTFTYLADGADRYPDAVIGPLHMGEESTEDYLPGTVLLGARTSPEAPWVLARNAVGEVLEDGSEGSAVFRYDFGILEEIEGTGTFAPVEDAALPTVRWTLRLRNRSRQSVEIGELGFPFALNNFGIPATRTDEGAAEVITSRFQVHTFAGGAGSFLAAMRMLGTPPTLVVAPRWETGFEFAAHVPASIRTPYAWEGIPVMYVHSRATVEREEWPEWFNGHSTLILEPGEDRVYELDFVAVVEPHRTFDVAGALAKVGRPGIRLRPGGVAPMAQGVAVEISGVRPTRFWTDRDASMEVDSESDGGACLVKARSPGPIRISFEDENGGVSHIQALLVPDPERSLRRRAAKLAKLADPKRRSREEGADLLEGTMLEIESVLGDATLLATLALRTGLGSAPAAEATLNSLVGRAIDPITLGVASFVPPDLGEGVALSLPKTGFELGSALWRLGVATGDLALRRAARRAWARALDQADHDASEGATWLAGVDAAKEAFELRPEITPIEGSFFDARPDDVLGYRYPFFAERGLTLAGLAEAMEYAFAVRDGERIKRYCRIALAAKSPAPYWWAYGADRRLGGPFESPRPEQCLPIATDRGELGIAPWTPAHSAMVLRAMVEGYIFPMEGTLALLEAGLFAPLGLLSEDGAATMAIGPDPASDMAGIAETPGDVGFALSGMLDAGIVVVDRQPTSAATVGARASARGDTLLVEPTLPAATEIVLPFLGLSVRTRGAVIRRAEIGLGRDALKLSLAAWEKGAGEASVTIEGLWGAVDPDLVAPGYDALAETGVVHLKIALDADGKAELDLATLPVESPFRREVGAFPTPAPLLGGRRYPNFTDDERAVNPIEEDEDDVEFEDDED